MAVLRKPSAVLESLMYVLFAELCGLSHACPKGLHSWGLDSVLLDAQWYVCGQSRGGSETKLRGPLEMS